MAKKIEGCKKPFWTFQVQWLAYLGYDKLWRSNFYINTWAKSRVQDINYNQLKLKVNETFKKDEKLTTEFEPSNPEYIIKKG